ncbi:hypothetical protein [Desulfobacter postgatei]|uniref:hypothetical protein n=1 Tax=Desulfobacter postgatei TaxID=2293 RepID=UPI00259BA58E|nr:hypothetical protein [uncultured Desulfobacter sp.]
MIQLFSPVGMEELHTLNAFSRVSLQRIWLPAKICPDSGAPAWMDMRGEHCVHLRGLGIRTCMADH